MDTLLEKVKTRGVVESLFQTAAILVSFIYSKIIVFLLRLRGFRIGFSAQINRNIYFFQSKKYAVVIGDKTQIGFGVRIKAGFRGEIHIGKRVLIDDYSYISAHEKIIIGDETMIASHVYIVDFNHRYPLTESKKNIDKETGYTSKPIVIGKHVWIGTHAIILPGITIGDGAVVGAGSIVTRSVPKNALVVGNPAKLVRR